VRGAWSEEEEEERRREEGSQGEGKIRERERGEE